MSDLEIDKKLATAGKWRVGFLTEQTNSGIQIAGTPVEQLGWLVAVNMIPTGPGQLQPLFMVLPDGAEIPVVTAGVRFLPIPA